MFGVAAVYGASSIVAVQNGSSGTYFASRQAIGVVFGGILLVFGARSDYHIWRALAWPFIGVVTLLLVALLLPFTDGIVREVNGARRWLGVADLSFQPAELAKFAVVAWTAMLATKKDKTIREFKRGVVPFLVILGPVAALVVFEPALSTAMLICLVARQSRFRCSRSARRRY